MSTQDAKRGLRNSIFLFVRMCIVVLIGVYTSRVVLNVLGFEDFGIYNVVGSVVSFFVFFNSALTNATSRYLTVELGTGNKEKLNQIYSMAINSHIILASVLFVILEFAGIWLINNKLSISHERLLATNYCFQFSLFTFCSKVIRVPFHSNIIAHEKMNFFATISIIEQFLQLLACVLIINSPIDKLVVYSFLMFIVSIIILFLYIFFSKRKLNDCKYLRFWNNKIIKDFATYSGYAMIVNAADGVGTQLRSIFFNIFAGSLANASLGVAHQFLSLATGFVDNVSQSFRPQILKSYSTGNISYFYTLIYSTSKMYYFLFLFIAIPLMLNIEVILTIWLGKYPPYTIAFTKAIIVFIMFDTFQLPLLHALHAKGQIRTHQIVVSFVKIGVVPVTYILLRLGYSATLTLYIWAVGNIICAIFRTIYMKYYINISLKKYFFDVFTKMIIVTILSLIIPYYLSITIHSAFQKLFLTTLISFIVVGLFTFTIGLNKNEKQFVLTLPIIRNMYTKIIRIV